MKFRRDGLAIDDIDGARSRQHVNHTKMEKQTMNVLDIEGAKPSPTTRTRRASSQFDSFNYSDVYAPNWSTSRRGDPQNPNYLVFDDNGKSYQIGEIEGNKPRKPIQPPNGVPREPLNVKDIAGAQSSTKNLGVFEQYHKR